MSLIIQHDIAHGIVQRVPEPADTGTQLIVLFDNNIKLPSTPFYIAVYPAAVMPLAVSAEIARVILVQETGVGTHILTIQRKSEGDVSRAVQVGDQVLCAVTSADLFAVKVASASAGKLSIINNYCVATPPSGGGGVAEMLLPFLQGTIVRPTLAGYSWINQGPASVSDSQYGLEMNVITTVNDLHILKKSLTGISSVEFCILPNFISHANTSFGILFRDSSSGKLNLLDFLPGVSQFYISKWNSPTAFWSHYTTTNPIQNAVFALLWLRLRVDATNRYFDWSNDGSHWDILLSIPKNDFLIPDEYGFYVKGYTPARKCNATFFSIKEVA